MRKEGGELAARFATGAGNERNELTVEPGFANQKTYRNRNTHPAIFQDIDREARPSGGEFAIDAKIIVNPRESSFDGRRLRFAFGGISSRVKCAVFLDRQDDPTRRMSNGLGQGAGRRNK